MKKLKSNRNSIKWLWILLLIITINNTIELLGQKTKLTSVNSNFVNYLYNFDKKQSINTNYLASYEAVQSTKEDKLNASYTTTDTWTGKTSSKWNESSNWSNNEVPTIDKDVTIPQGCKNYPVVDITATSKNLTIQNGGRLTINKLTNLSINGDFTVGTGSSGTFVMNDGSCSITGNFYTDLGSCTKIAGGSLNFTNWARNSSDPYAVGKITLTGGNISSIKNVLFASNNVIGKMNGPFNLNIGSFISISDNVWTVTDGTIVLVGIYNEEDMMENKGLSCSDSIHSAIAYNLIIKSELEANLRSIQDVIIKNDLSIEGETTTYISKELKVGGNITIANDVDFKCGNVDLTGDLKNEGFLFHVGSFVLSGNNQSISGENYFDNLIKKTGEKLTFEAGSTNQNTINGTLTLHGSPQQRLALRSSKDNEQWLINPMGTVDLNYIDVKDSKNINENVIEACNEVNSGNNTNWLFSAAAAGIIMGDSSVCKGSKVEYSVPAIEGADSYNWTLPNGALGISNSNVISVSFDNFTKTDTLKVAGQNSCGSGPGSYLLIKLEPTCTMELIDLVSNEVNIKPNPTHDIVEISLKDQEMGNYKIEIYNMTSLLESRIVPHFEKTTIDLTHYSSGVYFIKISNKSKSYITKVLKN